MKCVVIDEKKFLADLAEMSDDLPLIDYAKAHNIIHNSYFTSITISPTKKLLDWSRLDPKIHKFEALTYCGRTYILSYVQDKVECLWGYYGSCDLTLLIKILLNLMEESV